MFSIATTRRLFHLAWNDHVILQSLWTMCARVKRWSFACHEFMSNAHWRAINGKSIILFWPVLLGTLWWHHLAKPYALWQNQGPGVTTHCRFLSILIDRWRTGCMEWSRKETDKKKQQFEKYLRVGSEATLNTKILLSLDHHNKLTNWMPLQI